jgi:hypothetical protein
MVVYNIYREAVEMVSKINGWREEQVFQAIYVSERFLEEFNMKMLRAKVRNKAALFKQLLSGWIAGKYKLPSRVPKHVMAYAGKGGVGLSLYYPKKMDSDLVAKMEATSINSKSVVFRNLLYGWTSGDIDAKVEEKERVIVPCRSVGVALSPAINHQFRAKAAKQGYSKSKAIALLFEKWAKTTIGMGNSNIENHSGDHCFGIMLPSTVDDQVEKKMKKMRLTNKRILIRKLVDMYLRNRLKI